MDRGTVWVNPLVLACAAAVFLGVVVGAALFLANGEGGGAAGPSATPLPSSLVSGESIKCASGTVATTEVRTRGNTFELTGEFKDVGEGGLLVDTPNGEKTIKVSGDARADGQFLAGDWMTIAGEITGNGDWIAKSVTSPCGHGGDAVESASGTPTAGSATPAPVFPTHTEAATVTPGIVGTAVPVDEHDDDDDDDDDDGDREDGDDSEKPTRKPKPRGSDGATEAPTPLVTDAPPSETDDGEDDDDDDD